jgi:hypothetical protein
VDYRVRRNFRAISVVLEYCLIREFSYDSAEVCDNGTRKFDILSVSGVDCTPETSWIKKNCQSNGSQSLKTGIGPILEMSCISSLHQTMVSVQY